MDRILLSLREILLCCFETRQGNVRLHRWLTYYNHWPHYQMLKGAILSKKNVVLQRHAGRGTWSFAPERLTWTGVFLHIQSTNLIIIFVPQNVSIGLHNLQLPYWSKHCEGVSATTTRHDASAPQSVKVVVILVPIHCFIMTITKAHLYTLSIVKRCDHLQTSFENHCKIRKWCSHYRNSLHSISERYVSAKKKTLPLVYTMCNYSTVSIKSNILYLLVDSSGRRVCRSASMCGADRTDIWLDFNVKLIERQGAARNE